jgi:hypothetical protein
LFIANSRGLVSMTLGNQQIESSNPQGAGRGWARNNGCVVMAGNGKRLRSKPDPRRISGTETRSSDRKHGLRGRARNDDLVDIRIAAVIGHQRQGCNRTNRDRSKSKLQTAWFF